MPALARRTQLYLDLDNNKEPLDYLFSSMPRK